MWQHWGPVQEDNTMLLVRGGAAVYVGTLDVMAWFQLKATACRIIGASSGGGVSSMNSPAGLTIRPPSSEFGVNARLTRFWKYR